MTTFVRTPGMWDSDPGPGPLPPRWPSIEAINLWRRHYGMAELPSSRDLTATLRDYGFTGCFGATYLSLVPAEAAVEAAA